MLCTKYMYIYCDTSMYTAEEAVVVYGTTIHLAESRSNYQRRTQNFYLLYSVYIYHYYYIAVYKELHSSHTIDPKTDPFAPPSEYYFFFCLTPYSLDYIHISYSSQKECALLPFIKRHWLLKYTPPIFVIQTKYIISLVCIVCIIRVYTTWSTTVM